MKERLIEFLRAENKSSAQLAEEIGVQPSGISHILSGRNNPSLDFILKMLEKYPFLSTDWLLFGKGTMYKDGQMQSLFDEGIFSDSNKHSSDSSESGLKRELDITEKAIKTGSVQFSDTIENRNSSDITRIVWFYSDNSFKEYYPRNQD